MFRPARPRFWFGSEYRSLVENLGLNGEAVFTHPQIKVWRSISDRQNCTLDFTLPDGATGRWHIKRYFPSFGRVPADAEVAGIRLLEQAGIPTVPLVAHGALADGRSFVILADLAGHRPSDKLLFDAFPFDRLIGPTAALTARLHAAGLHHRDLYLCHFFVNPDVSEGAPRLIDCARVRKLPRFLTRERWIVKDLSQFWYSTRWHDISDDQRHEWLARYCEHRRLGNLQSLRSAIERKVQRILRHDRNLNVSQPNRNISIPSDRALQTGGPSFEQGTAAENQG